MKHKDSRGMLPIAPGNWPELKRNVPGLDAAAKAVQSLKQQEQRTPLRFSQIRSIDTKADYVGSMRILKENRLRPLTLYEVLSTITYARDLIYKHTGKWFYIAGKGTDGKLGIFTIQPDLSLKGGKSDNIEKNVHCFTGNYPLSFEIRTNELAANDGARYHLSAITPPDLHAPLIIGAPERAAIDCFNILRR